MRKRFERLISAVTRSNPFELEALTRALLVQYHFHCSQRAGIELHGTESPLLQLLTPTVFKGQGRIRIHATSTFGVVTASGSYACSYVESRTPESLIDIGPGCAFNNRMTLISAGAGIRIGARCLVGEDVYICDSNFHDLRVDQRMHPDPRPQSVDIGDDVFIGARAMLLKGVRLGRGCVVAAGAVLPPRFEAPPLSIIAGNPATIIGNLAAERAAPAPAA